VRLVRAKRKDQQRMLLSPRLSQKASVMPCATKGKRNTSKKRRKGRGCGREGEDRERGGRGTQRARTMPRNIRTGGEGRGGDRDVRTNGLDVYRKRWGTFLTGRNLQPNLKSPLMCKGPAFVN